MVDLIKKNNIETSYINKQTKIREQQMFLFLQELRKKKNA